MTRDFDDHRLRRRAWDKGFSIKGMQSRLLCNTLLTPRSSWHIRAPYQSKSGSVQESAPQERGQADGHVGVVYVL
jgi:hypothetical protein